VSSSLDPPRPDSRIPRRSRLQRTTHYLSACTCLLTTHLLHSTPPTCSGMAQHCTRLHSVVWAFHEQPTPLSSHHITPPLNPVYHPPSLPPPRRPHRRCHPHSPLSSSSSSSFPAKPVTQYSTERLWRMCICGGFTSPSRSPSSWRW
jgi:hypothetical protein